MIKGAGFVLIATLVLLGLVLWIAAAPDPVRMAAYYPPSFRTTMLSCPERGGSRPLIPDWEKEGYAVRTWLFAGEPSLYAASRQPGARQLRSWRFSLFRSFHPAVIVRVDEHSGGEMALTATQVSGRDIDRRLRRNLTREQGADLLRTLASTQVFDLPPKVCEGGADGATWVVEANDRGAYRFVSRWSPDDGPVHEVGMLFLSDTGWKLGPVS